MKVFLLVATEFTYNGDAYTSSQVFASRELARLEAERQGGVEVSDASDRWYITEYDFLHLEEKELVGGEIH
jgi:hypothetical protein